MLEQYVEPDPLPCPDRPPLFKGCDLAATCVAYYRIETPQGRKISFKAFIEDDGGCVNLKTPHDEREGSFTNLSDCLLL